MLAHSAHNHFIAVGGDVLGDGKLAVEFAAQLIEKRHLHVGADPDRSRIRRKRTGEQFQKRGLAGAVGAEYADALAAQNVGREIAYHLALTVGEGEVFDFDDAHAAVRGGIEPHLRPARGGAPRSELLAQLHERGDPPFVAGGAGLHATADPRFFPGEFLHLALPTDRLVAEQLLLASEKSRIVAFPAGKFAAVEIENLLGDAFEETPVVRDDEQRHVALPADHPLKPVDRFHIEMVRRLVEKQQIGMREKRLFEDSAAAPASGKRIESVIARAVGGDGLGNERHLQSRSADNLAGIRLQLPGDHLEQRRFSLSVASGERGAKAARDRKRNPVQHRRPAERERDIPKRKKKIAHCAAFRSSTRFR